MRCQTCTDYYDDDRQSVVCPHRVLDRPANPIGGIRITKEQCDEINEAFRMQDRIGLYRLMGSNNPAVRMYARDMSEALDHTLGL